LSRRRRKDPYPYVGTPEGDETIGKCDGRWCGKELRRGDQFVTTLSGHLVCRSCWNKPIGEWFPKEPDPEFNPVPDETEKPAEPDYGHDNPYF